jgi:hypothetical protein
LPFDDPAGPRFVPETDFPRDAMAIEADSKKRVVVAGTDNHVTFRVLDLQSGKEVFSRDVPGSQYQELHPVFSGDGSKFAYAVSRKTGVSTVTTVDLTTKETRTEDCRTADDFFLVAIG